MKKLLILVSILMVGFVAKSQYPVTQNLGSDSTLVTSKGALKSRLINIGFSDTTAANLQRIRQYEGAMIFTTSDSSIWLRGTGATKWIQMISNSGRSQDTLVWRIGGNYISPLSSQLLATFGSKDSMGIYFMTNSTRRLYLPANGINRSSSSANKYLMMDTTNLFLYYGDAGGSGSVTANNGLVVNSSGVVGLDTAGINPLETDVLIDLNSHRFSLNDSASYSSRGQYTYSNTGGTSTFRHSGNYTAGCTTCGLNTMENIWLQNSGYPSGIDTVINVMGAHNGPNDKHFYLADQKDDYAGPGIAANRLLTVEKNGVGYVSFYNNPTNNSPQVLIGFYPTWAITNYERYKLVVGGKLAVNDTAYFSGNVGIGTATPTAKLDLVGTLKYTDGNQASGYVLTSDASGNATWQVASGGSGLTIGTTAITSGTNTRILYNNSGVLGEYTISGSGNVAMTTSPTFTTPNIGVASGTSITLSSLTAGRVPYASTAGLLTDNSNMTFNGTSLIVHGGAISSGDITIGGDAGHGSGSAISLNTTHNTSEYTFLGLSNNLFINVPSGGSIVYRQNNSSTGWQFSGATLTNNPANIASSVPLWIQPSAAGNYGALIQAYSGQTQNLLEFRNSSNVGISAFDANGYLGLGTASPNASAILDITSTTKGFLTPRMTTTQKNAISSPAVGLQVYDTDLKQPQYNDGVTWKAQVGMTFGTAAPAITPAAIGNFFLDTTNKKLYISTGTSSSADWNILN